MVAETVNLQEYLVEKRRLVDKALDDMLPPEHNEPALLHQAMRYSVFAGGKRLRPILALASAEVVGGDLSSVLPLAVAIECVHTYSLIHDDLPAMDDDDLRRGKLTAHKMYGEAVAILAGDALLTLAFGILSSPRSVRLFRPERVLCAIHELAVASGSERLIAGQALDIMSETRQVDLDTVDRIVTNKTAALIRVSLTCGARFGGASEEQVQVLGTFGDCLGKAFQIRDDLLDLEGDPEKLGKAVRKDSQRGKATYPGVVGRDRAKQTMQLLLDKAVRTIAPLGSRAEILSSLAAYVGERVA
jgi:geranylgeranyl diphosphate synthase type II